MCFLYAVYFLRQILDSRGSTFFAFYNTKARVILKMLI